jgi:hypothetical protein
VFLIESDPKMATAGIIWGMQAAPLLTLQAE